eukprot:scaffold282503_cov19-Prasinocladus_malaysianus.AAC.1
MMFQVSSLRSDLVRVRVLVSSNLYSYSGTGTLDPSRDEYSYRVAHGVRNIYEAMPHHKRFSTR